MDNSNISFSNNSNKDVIERKVTNKPVLNYPQSSSGVSRVSNIFASSRTKAGNIVTNCRDNEYFGFCSLVVKLNFCLKSATYRDICCRSCHFANQTMSFPENWVRISFFCSRSNYLINALFSLCTVVISQCGSAFHYSCFHQASAWTVKL